MIDSVSWMSTYMFGLYWLQAIWFVFADDLSPCVTYDQLLASALSLSLIFVLRYVGSGYTDVVFRLSLYLLGLKLSLYVRIFYFVVICFLIRLHQCNQVHSTTWQVLLNCKYQILSIFPCCSLQNMNMVNDTFFIFSNYMWDVIMKRKSLSHDVQQFHQYQHTHLWPQNHWLQ